MNPILLQEATDDQLRAEALRRGLILHSQGFSQAAQEVIRRVDKAEMELAEIKQRVLALPKS